MKLAFIGAGNVGAALAVRLADAGHEVVLAESKEGSASVSAALGRSAALSSRPIADAARSAEVVFLATPFGANESILRPLADALAGKVLVDGVFSKIDQSFAEQSALSLLRVVMTPVAMNRNFAHAWTRSSAFRLSERPAIQ